MEKPVFSLPDNFLEDLKKEEFSNYLWSKAPHADLINQLEQVWKKVWIERKYDNKRLMEIHKAKGSVSIAFKNLKNELAKIESKCGKNITTLAFLLLQIQTKIDMSDLIEKSSRIANNTELDNSANDILGEIITNERTCPDPDKGMPFNSFIYFLVEKFKEFNGYKSKPIKFKIPWDTIIDIILHLSITDQVLKEHLVLEKVIDPITDRKLIKESFRARYNSIKEDPPAGWGLGSDIDPEVLKKYTSNSN